LELSGLRAKESTAEALRNQYGRTIDQTGILAGILVRPPQTPYDILIIGAGSDSGVEIGNNASLSGGIKIGRVIEVYSNTSTVQLYSSNGVKTQAILERNEVPIELIGNGGGNIIFHLSREMETEVGDRILDATILGSLIGVVEDIEVAPTDSFKKVLVKSIAPLNSVRFLHITE
jgi:cell shape-determining protein MreC